MFELFQGIVIGFLIAIPVGPIGLLCIRRSLAEGRTVGFVAGLGAATADAVYMTIAAMGLTAVTRALTEHGDKVRIGGGLFMLVIGLMIFFAKPATEAAKARGGSNLAATFGSTMVLTLMNPSTITSFLATLAAFGVNGGQGLWLGVVLIAGVFVGSAAWWFLLSLMACRFGRKLEQGGLVILNRVSGGFIMACGVWQLVAVWRG